MAPNVSYVMEFLAWWVLKSKVFAQKSTVVKWNCCILWIDIVWSLQKLGIILESKVVQKLSLEKNVFNKKNSTKLIFLDEIFFWKNSVNFWHGKLTLKVQFWHFLMNRNSSTNFYVDSWPKFLLFRTHHL